MRELNRLLADRCEESALDVLALELATIEYPALEILGFVELLDSHARELAGMLARTASGEEYVAAANEYLFGTLGFHGNVDDYYSARNSCLNEVLVSRTGIPITLAVIYMEIARRLGRPVEGIALPGHFLVRYNGEDYSAFVDCFHGRILTVEECRDLAMQISKIDIFAVPSALTPASKFQILTRMLNNLRNVYYRTQEFEKAIRVLDLLLEGSPDSAEEYKQRGVIHMHLRHAHAALQDLQAYLRLAPQAADREQIEKYVEDLVRHLRGLN